MKNNFMITVTAFPYWEVFFPPKDNLKKRLVFFSCRLGSKRGEDCPLVAFNLTHSFPMHAFSTPWKHRGLEKGCIGNEWVDILTINSFRSKQKIKLKVISKFKIYNKCLKFDQIYKLVNQINKQK